MTKEQLSAIMPTATPEIIERYYQPILDQASMVKMDTPLRLAHFLAQIGNETGDLRVTQENLNYSAKGLIATWPTLFNVGNVVQYVGHPEAIANRAYGGRYGNKAPGDGWKYRGRGCMQTTFLGNYLAFEKATGIKVVDNPDVVAADPHVCLRTATYFWESHNLNPIADADDVIAIRRRVNGGLIGIDEVKRRLALAKHVLGVA